MSFDLPTNQIYVMRMREADVRFDLQIAFFYARMEER
jgi:hypothetical protein